MRLAAAVALVGALLGLSSLSGCGNSSDAAPAASPTPVANTNQRAWAVGAHGTILATEDGGRHWHRQQSHTIYELSDVAFADATHGWVVGNANGDEQPPPIRATVDGGAHWTAQSVKGWFLPAVVACTDAQHAWIGGSGGSNSATIVATTDGGEHWVTQLRSTEGVENVTALVFADNLHGWAISEHRTLLATSDGGSHWSKQSLPGGNHELDTVVCTDAGHCWVGGSWIGKAGVLRPALWATSDGGSTWGSLPVPRGADGWMSPLAIQPGGRIVAASFDHTWRSNDNGRHWTPLTMPAAIDIAFADGTAGWAISRREIRHTTDAGASWSRPQTHLRDPVLQAVSAGVP